MSKTNVIRVIVIAIIIMLNITIIFLSYDGFFYTSEEDDLIKRTEQRFGIEEIEYKEILYFMPFSAGPLGEGDSCLVIKLTPESAKIVSRALRNNDKIMESPMQSSIKEYVHSTMYIESASYHLPELDSGFYGFYSLATDDLMSYEQLNKAIVNGETANLLNSYLYLQYDVKDEILFIWDYA